VKRVMYFIGLKLLELAVIAACCLLVWMLGYGVLRVAVFLEFETMEQFVFKGIAWGILLLCVVCAIWCIGALIYHLIVLNWDKAGELAERQNRRSKNGGDN